MAAADRKHAESPACLGERRRHRRLSVRLGVSLRLPADANAPESLERTITRNISPGDACVECSSLDRLRPGDMLEIAIDIPGDEATSLTGRRLHATGRVVRLTPDEANGPSGHVAVVFEGLPAFQPIDR